MPAVLLALVQLGPAAALRTAAGYLAVNVFFGNVLEPRFMGCGVGLSPLVVFLRGALRPGDRLAGPAIVAERESTALLPPGAAARVSGEGSLLIEVSAPAGGEEGEEAEPGERST